ncbi:MAG TPA: 2Fe-2S iron-sulfur cluster-binding protein [Bryobacteraceae bacterium]|nr:2Fe-2S iron-sulfur cluster-binding protein [Bryobacteraceae bacterium]
MKGSDSFLIVLETPKGERSFTCHRNEFIWNAAAHNGITLPAICHQGRCLTCAGCVLSGSFDQSSANSYFPEDKVEGYILLCTAKPCSDLRLRTNQQHAMRQYRAKLGLPAPYL